MCGRLASHLLPDPLLGAPRATPLSATFSCLAKRKVTKEKTTRLRCPSGSLASGLKPGDAETHFATIVKEAKLEHPHCC
jgi:hypothetical protein